MGGAAGLVLAPVAHWLQEEAPKTYNQLFMKFSKVKYKSQHGRCEKKENGNKNDNDDDRLGSGGEVSDEEGKKAEEGPATNIVEETTTDTNFLQLTLDIPEKPLFKDEEGGLVIAAKNHSRTYYGNSMVSLFPTPSTLRPEGTSSNACRHLLFSTFNGLQPILMRGKRIQPLWRSPVKNFDLSSYVASDKQKEHALPLVTSSRKCQCMNLRPFCRRLSVNILRNMSSTKVEPWIKIRDRGFCIDSLPEHVS
jgi:hypothetical protein